VRASNVAVVLLVMAPVSAAACGSRGDATAPDSNQSTNPGPAYDAGYTAPVFDGGGSPGDEAGIDATDAETTDAETTDAATIDAPSGDAAAGDADAGPVFPPACPQSSTWPTTARVPSIAAAGFDRFGGISAGALSVAWTTAAGAVYVADRATATSAFGAQALLDPGAIALASGRVALAPTGLELVATRADGSSFVSFFRTSLSGAWSPTSSKEFDTIAAMRGESGGGFSEPVISAGGNSLFYLLALPNQAPVLYESTWDATIKAWGTGAALPNAEFAISSASQARRPTGAASDGRTLFFFDEVSGVERAAWRDSPASPFSFFASLPSLPEAAPVDDCTTLYFHGSDSAGQGLFTGS